MRPADHTTTQRIAMIQPPRRRPSAAAIAVVVAALAAGIVGTTLVILNATDGGRAQGRTERPASGQSTVPSGPAPTAAPASTTAPRSTTPTTPTTAPERLSSASRLSLDGIGPVDIGMTLDEASAAAGVKIRPLNAAAGPECSYAAPERSAGMGDELSFMVRNGRIVRVDVGRMGPDKIRTVSGIGKGNTEAEVQATYPGRIKVEPHPYIPNGHNLVYVPNDPGLRHLSLIFETVDGTVRAFRSGLADAVALKEQCG